MFQGKLQCIQKANSSESKNARKGIKTFFLEQGGVSLQPWSESKNARKGIKTHGFVSFFRDFFLCQNQKMPVRALRPHSKDPFLTWHPRWSESKNARKGIKTRILYEYRDCQIVSQNQKMPVRALRLD